jgi:hypothetical protein
MPLKMEKPSQSRLTITNKLRNVVLQSDVRPTLDSSFQMARDLINSFLPDADFPVWYWEESNKVWTHTCRGLTFSVSYAMEPSKELYPPAPGRGVRSATPDHI